MLDAIISLYAPHICLVCGKEGDLWCAQCRQLRRGLTERCYSCHKLSSGNRTCETCRRTSKLFAVYVAASYEGAAKELVGRLKFSGARAAIRPAATLMAPMMPDGAEVVVPVPTASSRVRTRGYDQAVLLARSLAGRTSLLFAPILRRTGQARQVGASREQRRAQLHDAFRVGDMVAIRGRHVVLIDDVVTTGATLEAAAAALKSAGARRVSAVVFARA
jgi:ComF family protein